MEKRSMLFIILIAFYLSIGCLGWEYDENVLVLNDENFEEGRKTFQPMLVEFYAPWCGHCKRLAPEYAKAAKKLKQIMPNVVLAKIDATVNRKTADEFQIRGYPTLKFLVEGQIIDYTGGRTEDAIVNWVKQKLAQGSKEIKTKEELEKIKADNEVVVIFFGKKDEHFETFERIGKTFEDVVFAHTFNEELKKTENVKMLKGEFGVIMFKKFDEKRNDFEGDFSEETFKQFVSKYSVPNVMPFNDKTAGEIFGKQKPAIVLFYGDNEASKNAQKEIDEAAPKLKEFILIAKTKYNEGLGQRLSDFIGVKERDVPTVRLLFPNGPDFKKFVLEQEITAENIVKFFNDFKNGILKPMYKSEPIPTEQKGPVIKIVGKTWEQIVFDKTKDVFVKYYNPHDPQSKDFAPIFEKVAQKLKVNPNIILGEYDVTENENEGLLIRTFPQFKLYRAKDKAPKDFTGEKSEKALLEFLKKEASVEWVEIKEEL